MFTRDYRLSICFCTRQRPRDLQRALASVSQSSIPVAQIVVSDDSEDDETERLVHELGGITYLRGPRRGLGANRNQALSAASGTHILFMDDDTALGPDFVEKIGNAYQNLPPEERPRAIISGLESLNGKLIRPSDLSFFGYVDKERTPETQVPLHTAVINATVWPREAFSKIAFDTNLVYGSDEVDICTQAIAVGFHFYLCPEAVNKHFHSPVHRKDYARFTQASRLYTTMKRYVYLERSAGKAAAYMLLGPLHLLQGEARKLGLAGAVGAFHSMQLATRYFFRYATGASRASAPLAAAD